MIELIKLFTEDLPDFITGREKCYFCGKKDKKRNLNVDSSMDDFVGNYWYHQKCCGEPTSKPKDRGCEETFLERKVKQPGINTLPVGTNFIDPWEVKVPEYKIKEDSSPNPWNINTPKIKDE